MQKRSHRSLLPDELHSWLPGSNRANASEDSGCDEARYKRCHSKGVIDPGSASSRAARNRPPRRGPVCLADQIETRYQKAKTHVDKLTQSILAKAFRGELVPQDPNDEPASKLLERIRSEGSDMTSSQRKRESGESTMQLSRHVGTTEAVWNLRIGVMERRNTGGK